MMLYVRFLTQTNREKLGAALLTWGVRIAGCSTTGSIAVTAIRNESATWFQVFLVSILAGFCWNTGRDEARAAMSRRSGWDA